MTDLLDATTVVAVEPAAQADSSRPHSDSDEPGTAASHAARIGWSLVGLFVAFSGQQAWTGSLGVPGANVAAILLVAGGLAALWCIWSVTGGIPVWLQLALLIGMVVGVSYQAALTWLFDPSYGTDAVAFDQYAAWMTLHGSNPYAHSMEPSLNLFHVPAIYHTYRLDGSAVTALSYPAGSFLAYMPLMIFGVSTQAANIVDLVSWFTGMFLLWRMLPRDSRWVAGLVGGAFVYVGFVIGGLTDALFVPFVLLAVYKWDRFAWPGKHGIHRWIGPLSLGVAMSIKQTPWFLAPYLVLGLYFEARAHGINPFTVVGRYLAAVAAPFILINGAFIAADPTAWVKGTLVPFLDPTIPDGQGLINLTIFERLGGGDLRWFTLLGLSFVLLTILAFSLKYSTLKRAWVPLIAISFFLPTRSFGSYLFMLVPAALVAATTVAPALANPYPRMSRYAKHLLALGALATVVIGALALGTPAPLAVTVIGTRSTGQLQTLNQVTVQVTNRTGKTVHPAFTVNANNHATTFWYARNERGPYTVVLGPHQSQAITLQAPNTASMPGVTAPLLVEAFTTSPATVSASARYLVSSTGTRITPDAVDRPVPVGQPVIMTVQAENQYGAPIKRAGIPITLGQTVYGQDAFYAGEASINGHPEGFSPVMVLTDAQGQAKFTIIGMQPQLEPVYFQALIQRDGQVPHGYSNQVTIQFIAQPGS